MIGLQRNGLSGAMELHDLLQYGLPAGTLMFSVYTFWSLRGKRKVEIDSGTADSVLKWQDAYARLLERQLDTETRIARLEKENRAMRIALLQLGIEPDTLPGWED